MDKEAAKQLFLSADIPTAPWVKWPASDVEIQQIGWPVIVKPARAGSTVGLSLVQSRQELPAAARAYVAFAEEAKLWVEPATGCLVPAARQVIERTGGDVSLGFVVCGGNVTHGDVRAWADRLL